MLGPTNFVLMEVKHRKSERVGERNKERQKYKTLIEYSNNYADSRAAAAARSRNRRSRLS